jgi:hypothetical protein
MSETSITIKIDFILIQLVIIDNALMYKLKQITAAF